MTMNTIIRSTLRRLRPCDSSGGSATFARGGAYGLASISLSFHPIKPADSFPPRTLTAGHRPDDQPHPAAPERRRSKRGLQKTAELRPIEIGSRLDGYAPHLPAIAAEK